MPCSPSHLRLPPGSPLLGRLLAMDGTGMPSLTSGFPSVPTHHACAAAPDSPAQVAARQMQMPAKSRLRDTDSSDLVRDPAMVPVLCAHLQPKESTEDNRL